MKTSISAQKDNAALLNNAGFFISVVAHLIDADLAELDAGEAGRRFMTSYHIGGLMVGLRAISDQLSGRGEHIEDLVEKEEAKQEKIALAALERRQSENTVDNTKVRNKL